ncbi:MAG: hypothetical protein GWM92_19330, partial [Gemmatimonadetes bacterium]|nr:hypothetical protein [Gemmatimonadota bacterium]NIR80956.1 hypothetical protein [Gemmatimonadota bacterium]NIT89774.1 hypothetical protein [Gemmatimonadota bacterium]NIU33560.1 hypothetical protein [Gemmatimonadota bacterium]NIU37829.1 hypothetical protein [Gemmatimonadota bacterium]
MTVELPGREGPPEVADWRSRVPARRASSLALGILLALGFAGCGGDVPAGGVVDPGDTDGEPSATTLSVFMIDAPGDLSRAWVRADDVVLVR